MGCVMAVAAPSRESAEFRSLLRMNAGVRDVFRQWVVSELSYRERRASAAAVSALFDKSSHSTACVLHGEVESFRSILDFIDRAEK